MDTAILSDVPAHVPPHLVVRDFPLAYGSMTTENPFDTLIASVHTGPDLVYVPKLFAGGVNGWVPRRDADLRLIYQDTEHFSASDTAPFPALTGANWRVLPLESDPPMHHAYRAVLNPVFTPKKMAEMDEKIRRYAAEYIEGFRAAGRVDFLHEFALEFPIKVFLELMGLPLDRVRQFLEWENGLLHATDVSHLIEATNSVIAYLREEIEDRKRSPRDDLVTHCVQAKGENGRALSDDEIVGFCFNLFIGGLDTVSTNMTWQFIHLARNHEHQRLLRENPRMIPDAIEEFMRAYAAVMTFRVCIKDTVLNGVTIKAGDMLGMPTTLAARDPAAWDRPNEVVLDRKPRHVSFGYGPHLCVGIHLARREMRMAMEEFLARIPEFSLAPDVQMVTALHGVIQPDTVPLVWAA